MAEIDVVTPVPSSAASPDALATRSINTIRTLAMDAVERAKSGHPGAPMGLAPLAYALWTAVMRYDAARPGWPDRDRFVLSCGHASMLQYALLHLTGYGLTLADLQAFRQWGSRTPGHPESEVAGVETTTGPLGQGFGNAVGMALAERMLAARFNRPGFPLFDHRTWVIASDGDLMEGVSQEAAGLAGHLGLSRLCVFYDANRITIDGSTDLAFTEDVAARFRSQGWRVIELPLDAEPAAYVAAADQAREEPSRPTLVVAPTRIGYGAPHKQDTAAAHGAPLGAEEVRLAKRQLGWPEEATFLVPGEVQQHMREAGRRGAAAAEAWERMRAAYREAHPAASRELDRVLAGELPRDWARALPDLAGGSMATRKSSGMVLQALKGVLAELVGGSADLAESNCTHLAGEGAVAAGHYGGRNIHFGVREHAMGAIANGMALHGGLRPFVGTFLVFSDYMRPSIRLASLMGLGVVYVFTHDSVGLGEDGPTHQPVEHLAALRAIPGLQVIRPADAAETVEAWRLALERDGPTALVLTRQDLPSLRGEGVRGAEGAADGAYVLWESAPEPELVLLASGSEVQHALAAARVLGGEGRRVRVVSFPSWERFAALDEGRQAAVLGRGVPRVAVEAGASMGWHRWIGDGGRLVTLDRFGASAPGGRLMEAFGFTSANVLAVARRVLGAPPPG
jgi:transketolase